MLQRGDTSVTLAYQRANISQHFSAEGAELSRGRIRGNALFLALDYALSNRFAINVGLPYVASSYHGASPHKGSILDDGSRHSAYQDLRIDLRYHTAIGETRVTPFVGVLSPTHRYAYFGHAAGGHDLRERSAGVNIERSLDRILPGSYVQARYAFTLAEKVLGISHNRHNVDFNAGYFVHPRISVRASWSMQKTIGGIDLPVKGPPLKGDYFIHHDQIGRADYTGVGAGATFQVNDRVDVFAVAQQMLHGRNTHKLDLSPSIGVTYSFSMARAPKACAIN